MWRVVMYKQVTMFPIEWRSVSGTGTPERCGIAVVHKTMCLIRKLLATVLHVQRAACTTADLSAIGCMFVVVG